MNTKQLKNQLHNIISENEPVGTGFSTAYYLHKIFNTKEFGDVVDIKMGTERSLLEVSIKLKDTGEIRVLKFKYVSGI